MAEYVPRAAALAALCRPSGTHHGSAKLIRVVAGLIEREGRLLICQRRRESVFGLQWEFPGGKLKASETPRAGLARELREELGVTARTGAEIHRTRHRYRELGSVVQIVFFRVGAMFSVPRNLVFERLVWARPGDLLKYDFLPADRELVVRLARKALRRPNKAQRNSSLRSE